MYHVQWKVKKWREDASQAVKGFGSAVSLGSSKIGLCLRLLRVTRRRKMTGDTNRGLNVSSCDVDFCTFSAQEHNESRPCCVGHDCLF